MEVYLIRHPEVANPNRLCYGHYDIGLADGYAQAIAALEQRLPDLTDFQVFSSPSSRCQVAAKTLFGDRVATDPRLMELHFGNWEGVPWQDLPRDAVDVWSKDLEFTAPHGGERGADLLARCRAFWRERVAEDKDTVIFSHLGWIGSLLSILLETPFQKAMLLRVDYLGLTKIESKDEWMRVAYVNR